MRRHRFDPVSLFFGVVFAAVGLTFLFGTVDLAALPPAWSWPIPLMIVGALIILLAVRSDRSDTRSRQDQWVPVPAPTPTSVPVSDPVADPTPDPIWPEAAATTEPVDPSVEP